MAGAAVETPPLHAASNGHGGYPQPASEEAASTAAAASTEAVADDRHGGFLQPPGVLPLPNSSVTGPAQLAGLAAFEGAGRGGVLAGGVPEGELPASTAEAITAEANTAEASTAEASTAEANTLLRWRPGGGRAAPNSTGNAGRARAHVLGRGGSGGHGSLAHHHRHRRAARQSAVVWQEEGPVVGGVLGSWPGSCLLLLCSWLLGPMAGLLLFCCLPPRCSRSAPPLARPLLPLNPKVPAMRKKGSGCLLYDDDSHTVEAKRRLSGPTIAPPPAPAWRLHGVCVARAGYGQGGADAASPPPTELPPLPLPLLLYPGLWRLLPRWALPRWVRALGALPAGGAAALKGIDSEAGCETSFCQDGGGSCGGATPWPVRQPTEGELLSPAIISSWRRRSSLELGRRAPLALSQLPDLHGSEGNACLLREAQRARLLGHLPASISLCAWELLYSTEQHGCSLRTAYQRLDGRGPSVLLVRDGGGRIFGGFASHSWHVSSHYFGTGEAFLFSAAQEGMAFYHWTGANTHFLLGAPDSLGFGGGGNFGLWLDESFEYGSSGKSDTYANQPLASSPDFRVMRVEFWGFTPSSTPPGSPAGSAPPVPGIMTSAARTLPWNI